jgi:hypothetical protein
MTSRAILLAAVIVLTRGGIQAQVVVTSPECPAVQCPAQECPAVPTAITLRSGEGSKGLILSTAPTQACESCDIQEEKTKSSKKSESKSSDSRQMRVIRTSKDGKTTIVTDGDVKKLDLLGEHAAWLLKGSLTPESSVKSESKGSDSKQVRRTRTSKDGKTTIVTEGNVENLDTDGGASWLLKLVPTLESSNQEEKSKKPAKKEKAIQSLRIRKSDGDAPEMIEIEEVIQEELKGKHPKSDPLRKIVRMRSAAGAKAPEVREGHAVLFVDGEHSKMISPEQIMKWVGEKAETKSSHAFRDKAGNSFSFTWNTTGDDDGDDGACDCPSLDAIRKVVREELQRALKQNKTAIGAWTTNPPVGAVTVPGLQGRENLTLKQFVGAIPSIPSMKTEALHTFGIAPDPLTLPAFLAPRRSEHRE